MSRYVIWTIQSPHGALEQPINCIFEDIWRIHHLLGVDSMRASWQWVTENRMSYQGKTRTRSVIWTIQSCHSALEQPVNCIFEYILRIHHLLGVDSFSRSWQSSAKNGMSYEGKTTSFEPFRFAMAPYNSPSTASLETFEGSLVCLG